LAQASGTQSGEGGDAVSAGGRLRLPDGVSRDKAPAGVRRYPEWQQRSSRYLPDHVALTEVIPLAEPGAPSQADAPPPDMPGLQQALARVAVRIERVHRQPKGNDIDLDALIDLRVQQRAGASPHANVYIANQPGRRDLATLVLLDISRSTADRGPDGLTVLQRHAAIGRRIVQVLDRLGDRTAFYGFQSWGRSQVRALRLKGFDEPARVAHERVKALLPAGLTRTGAAIRHATHLLLADHHREQRLMLLLTDGFAYDDDYEGAHALADCERALQEAAAQGVACVCLHVGTDQPDAQLKRLYGDTAYLKQASAGGLAMPLARLIGTALQRAAGGPAAARAARG
jgi:nitric oxide reductase activation protein